MTLTISLSQESEERLRKKAAELGQPLDVYAARVLEEAAKIPCAPAGDQVTRLGFSGHRWPDQRSIGIMRLNWSRLTSDNEGDATLNLISGGDKAK